MRARLARWIPEEQSCMNLDGRQARGNPGGEKGLRGVGTLHRQTLKAPSRRILAAGVERDDCGPPQTFLKWGKRKGTGLGRGRRAVPLRPTQAERGAGAGEETPAVRRSFPRRETRSQLSVAARATGGRQALPLRKGKDKRH